MSDPEDAPEPEFVRHPEGEHIAGRPERRDETEVEAGDGREEGLEGIDAEPPQR
jgi:hypothetical protein